MNDVTLYETRDGIAHFVFNRPQARNALTFEMYEHLREACEQADAESSIKALLIYGAGDKAFASGTDIAEFRALQSAQDAVDYEIKIERVLSTLEKCRVPDHRRDRRGLHRRRRGHRRLLRPAAGCKQRPFRLPDRADFWATAFRSPITAASPLSSAPRGSRT